MPEIGRVIQMKPRCLQYSADTADLYVLGRLPDDQAASYEEHFLVCVSCCGQVEISLELRKVLACHQKVAVHAVSRSSLQCG